MMAERRDARGYLIALAAMAMALSVRWPLYPVLGENRPYLTLFAAVAFAVWVARWRPATVAAIVGFFGANYFLAGPQPAFTLDSLFVFDLVGYALSAGLIVFFGESLHRERERAEHEHTQRKEAEELERRQKELLRVTLASIGDGVIVTDAEGRISFLNAEAERLTGWSASDAAGQPLLDVFDIVNEDTRARAENPVDEALRTNAVVGLANHTVLRSKDGSETPIEDSAAPIRAGQELPSGVVLVFRDVSAQRLAQRSNARLAAIIDNSGDAIFTKDLNGVIQTWNAGATKLFGYLPEEIIGKPIMLLVPPHLAGEESQILARLRAGQPSEYIETTRVARDGRHIPVSVSVSPLRDGDGTVIGASKIVRDITDIIAAREALARERELLATTLASIGDGVITTDSDARITYLNPVAVSLTGWTQDDAFGKSLDSVFRIVNEETRAVVVNPAMRALREGVIVGLANHTVLIRRDDSELPIDDSAAPIKDASGRILGCVLVFRDITVRRAADVALRDSEERFRRLVEQVRDYAIYMLDPLGHVVSWNAGAERITQYTAEEIVGQHVSVLYPEQALREGRPTSGLETARTQGRWEDEGWRLRKGGAQFWANVIVTPVWDGTGVLRGFASVTRDLTERRRAAETLRSVLDHVIDGILTIDEQGVLQTVNPAAQRLFGYESDEIVGKNVKMLMPPPYRDEHDSYIANYLRTGQAKIIGSGREVQGRRKNGSTFPMELAVSAFELDGKRHFTGIVRDISERKRYEEALLAADRHKNEFMAILAHELRNPLAPVSNALQIMRLAGEDEATASHALGMAERQIGHMVRLVDDLLDVARISRGRIDLRKTDVELATVIRQAVEITRPMADLLRHQVSVTLPPEPIHLHADPVRLAQVFSNVLSNACKYTEPGGHVRLTAWREGSDAVVSVKDTGIGIPADMLPRVFDMFTQVHQTLERSQGGLGIGLTLVKQLLEMHGGTITANSAGPGHGSEFVLRLPLVVASHGVHHPGAARRHSYVIPRRRILVADDNRDNAESLATLLNISGHETRLAFDGLEAIQATAEFRPELVLLDIGMPGLNGYETCRSIRESEWGKNIVVVALTGWGQEEDRRKSEEAGFDHHMVKPVEYTALMKLLRESAQRSAPAES